ncbi:MAG: NUDIX hydrolase N-terminal domain-containing protein [Succinivibrio sp.]|nr:NUDIX hydrolase N-terminal domain-containing protein [Succinivibrio sp.]
MTVSNRYRHVLFDLDGTIYDSVEANLRPLLEVIKAQRPDTTETYESLLRFAGTPALSTLQQLGFKTEEFDSIIAQWFLHLKSYVQSVKMFDGVLQVIRCLKERGVSLGIITSRDRKDKDLLPYDLASVLPSELAPFFSLAIGCSDAERGKPYGDQIRLYMQKTGAAAEEILYVGDTLSDLACAEDAGVDFGLALWGSHIRHSVKCTHYFLSPWEIINAVSELEPQQMRWFSWAREIQAIGQIGLTYTKDGFDRERFIRLREIACQMLSAGFEESAQKITEAFCFDKGYITPKLDTRAAIFNDRGEILLVREAASGKWNMPGGWCDETQTVMSNVVKESREEAGMTVTPVKFIALVDRNRSNTPRYCYGVLKAFVECTAGEGEFVPNLETTERGWFAEDNLPLEELRLGTNTPTQIMMCFAAHKSKNWIPVVD